jgi:hypothetical protein
MSIYQELATREKRQQEAAKAALIVDLLAVFRAARLLCEGAERMEAGLYRLRPEDFLALGTALDKAAANITIKEGR